jgi:hypothetical protein
MTAATNSDQQATFTSEINSATNVVCVLAARYQCRVLIVHAIPDFTSTVVIRMAREQDRPGHSVAELLERSSLQFYFSAVERNATNTGVG